MRPSWLKSPRSHIKRRALAHALDDERDVGRHRRAEIFQRFTAVRLFEVRQLHRFLRAREVCRCPEIG